MNPKQVIAALAVLALVVGNAPARGAESSEARVVGRTPPRLSFIYG